MGVLNVNNFGGQAFGVNKRDLMDNAAQVATNMQARVNTFTPLNTDSAPFNLQSVGMAGLAPLTAGTKVRTMFRYPYRNTGQTTILGSDKALSVVKGQIIDDTHERCYMADDTPGANLIPYVLYGGSAAAVRPLGVPAPTTELTYAQNGVAQLTAEHLANVQAANETIILQNFDLMLNRSWGGRAASASTPGYLDCTAASDAAATGYGMKGDKPYQARIFGTDGAGITFSALSADYFTWALGTEFSTHTYSSSLASQIAAWGVSVPAGGNFAAIKYRAFYPVFSLGAGTAENAARAAILAIKQPGKTGADYILTAPQLTALEARVTALASTANPGIAAAIARIDFRYELLTQLMDGKIGTVALAKLNAFLATAPVQTRINNAYDTFASAVWEKMNKAYLTPANANTTYTGTSYPQITAVMFAPTKSVSVAYIKAAAMAMLTGDGTPTTSNDTSKAVSPYVAVRPISRLQTYLDAEKLTIYNAAPAARQDAVFQAALVLDFTSELYDLYAATTIEAMKDLASMPDIFVNGGETTAEAVSAARGLLDFEISNLEAYYATLPAQIRLLIKSYLKEVGSNDLHADIDPSGKQVYTTRFYTWTYVNDWDEESQDWAHAAGLSPTALEVDQNDTVTLTLTGTVPSGYGITKWRVYRSNSATDTKYQLVKEATIATLEILDDLMAEELQDTLATDIWSAPPSETVNGVTTHIQGFVNMPNNFLAGFIHSTVYFSEVSAFYAWPPDYAIAMGHEIIGIEVFGQTLVVLTEGGPYYVTGADPAAMSKTDPESNQACLSKRSIAKVSGGVVFASPNGICIASGSGVELFLPSPLGKTAWALLKPELMQCAEYNGVLYIAGGDYNENPAGGWQAVYGLHLPTMKLTAVDVKATAFYSDRTSDSLYIALPHAGGAPQAVRAMADDTQYRVASWRSKRMTLQAEDGFAWMQVIGSQTTAAPATIKLIGYVVDSAGTEIAVDVVNQAVTDIRPVRVGPGRFLEYEVEVSSKAQLSRVVFASSTEELKQIA